MSRLLKFIIFIIAFCFFTLTQSSQINASQFVDAITNPGTNLQKFIVGEDVVTSAKPQGMLTTLADGLTFMILGGKDQKGNIISQGATGQVLTLINTMNQNPVVSSTEYFAYLKNNSPMASPVYAQSKGADFLKPVLNLWVVTRNVVYVLYVVIFVAIGFMVMFRSKLNPQTVINIQLALPGIIISLILVTFSFALCGFIVDIAYLGNGLIENIFRSHFVVNGIATWSNDATPFSLIDNSNLGGNLNSALSAIKALMGGGGTAALLNVIIAMTVISTAFKIFFTMLTKYISLLLITLLSPFSFLISAIPGSSGASINTLKQLLAAALVFPAVSFMTNLAYYFSTYAEVITADFQNLDPFRLVDFVDYANKGNGLLQNNPVAIATIAGLLALGVLMAAAQIPQVIDGALGVKPTLGAGTGEEIGGALKKIPIIGGMIG